MTIAPERLDVEELDFPTPEPEDLTPEWTVGDIVTRPVYPEPLRATPEPYSDYHMHRRWYCYCTPGRGELFGLFQQMPAVVYHTNPVLPTV